jgi:two-component system, OmpR family, sensor histidine kinase VicK
MEKTSTRTHHGESGRIGQQDLATPPPSSSGRDWCDLDFVTMVGHELRHACGVVSGFLDLLVNEEVSLDEQQTRHFLVRARDNAHRMNRLIADVTAAIHLGSGRFSFAVRPIDLRRVVESTTSQMGRIAGRTIEVEQPASLPQVVADRDRQIQIMTNLLSNAVEYSPDDSVVRIVLEPRGDEVVVNVHNDGPAASEEELQRLFEPFIRLASDAPSQSEGLGLGLYITKLLVEGQGGRIHVDSDHDGWTFSYTVPTASTTSAGVTDAAG